MYDVELHGDDLLYADGGSVVLMRVAGDGTLSRLSAEARPRRDGQPGAFWLGVKTLDDGRALLLATDGLYAMELPAHTPAPAVDVARQNLVLRADAGKGTSELLQIRNHGDAELVVWIRRRSPRRAVGGVLRPRRSAEPRSGEPSCLRIPVGFAAGALEVRSRPGRCARNGEVRLRTNDPDDPRIAVTIRANPVAPRGG